MKIATKLSLLAVGLLYSIVSISQENSATPKWCATDEMVAKALKDDPQLLQAHLAEQARLEQLDKQAFAQGYPGQNNRVVYTVPVVFHVLHENGTENISDAQIHDAVRILNEDFSKTNADISQVVSTFQGITGKVDFNFVLAKKDPNGNCTNGIERIVTNETNIGDYQSMQAFIWPRNKYLNIFTVKTISSGAAGFTFIPGTSPGANADGIVILNTYVGSIGTGNLNLARALTHEVGHWFGLNHVWGPNNNAGVACGDDQISDTPQTMGWTTCNLSGNTCGGGIDNVQNFLEYSYCTKMFTAGQATKMQNVITSSTASRNNLWSATNLAATGVSTPLTLCKADFKSNATSNSVCQGSSLTYTDLSWNGTPTSWNWVFQGGTPASSTSQSPVIQYNTPGVYSVTLTVSNSSGTQTATKTGYVTVYSSPGFNGVYSESFEGTAIPNAHWQVNNNNSGSNTWVQTNAAAVTGTNSVRIVNAASYVGNIDELISEPINMTTVGTSPKLTFKVAHAQKITSNDTAHDQLSVLVSTNCGQTWQQRMVLINSTLASAPAQSTAFIPTSSQWLSKTINLAGNFATSTNLLVMFRFISDGGNNIYLDDINMAGTPTGIEDELAANLNFNVYPNPMESNSIMTFTLLNKQNVAIKIMDIVGRDVATIYDGNLNVGDHQYTITKEATFSAGIYVIKMTINNQVFTKKLIVK